MHIRSTQYGFALYVIRMKHHLGVATFTHAPVPNLGDMCLLRSMLYRTSATGRMDPKATEPASRVRQTVTIIPGDVMYDALP